MIGPGKPEDVISLHPFPSNQNILQRIVQGMSYVEDAGDVGRWDNDAIGLPLGVFVGSEEALPHPEGIPAFLHLVGIIGFVENS
jgi:hypothetical protein